MTQGKVRRSLQLTVGQRLFLGLLPSLLAVVLVLFLAYYGEYGRQAPGLVVAAAAILAIVSVIGTFLNTRYLTRRITRLAGTMPSKAHSQTNREVPSDELDRIEEVVDRLGSALSASERERIRSEATASAKLREEATLLAAVVRDTMARLDDVRLPLHILLETRFGDLNENQEELLASARDAATSMDDALQRLQLVADADRGALPVQWELVQVNDVVRAVLPLARAAAERHSARIVSNLEPGLPRVHLDRSRLAQALTLLTGEAANATSGDVPLTVTTERDRGIVMVTITPAGESLLADRLVNAIGGTMARTDSATTLRLGEQP